jgi:V/A-type H+/Na+-transporting ATPase subunit I
MRIDVKKFLFVGLEEEREHFFKKAQDVGIIDFIEGDAKVKEVPADVNNITEAIKILRGLPTMEQEELEEYALAEGLVHKILELKHHLEKLQEEHRVVRLEITRVHAFGNFSKEDIAKIEKEGHRKIQFYFAKHGVAHEQPLPDEVIYIGTEHELDYFVAINHEPTQYPKLVEMHIEQPLGILKKRYKEIEKEIHLIEQRLKAYAKYNTFLHHALVYKLNQYYLHAAQKAAKPTMNDALFAIEGWVPENKLELLNNLINHTNVHAEEIAIEPTDKIPTYLENHGNKKIGEDVIRIYDTPSITDKDPSIWVLMSFALFFAFIVGDGGYGLIFLAVALYLHYKFSNVYGVGKRFIKLLTILSVACIAWGLLTNSFFGITIGPESPWRKVSILNWLVVKKTAYHMEHHDATYDYWVKQYPQLKTVTDPQTFIKEAATKAPDGEVTYKLINIFSDNIMMELALLIGITHIIISMLRYIKRNPVNIGWIAVIIGGYLYVPSYLHATSLFNYLFNITPANAAVDGVYLMIGGVTLAMIIAIFKHKLLGTLEIMAAIQIFSDILSYLRLYALALAGAMVTATMNENIGNLPFVVGILLLIFGHAVNILLSVMSGIIHGLRLNFLEWYHYSFEGGGKLFKPLHKMQIE